MNARISPALERKTAERLKILQMIEESKISTEEGSALLEAFADDWAEPAQAKTASNGGPKWFRVRVTDMVTGKTRTSVTLPLWLVGWGLNVGARFAPEISSIDLEELQAAFTAGVEGKILEVLDEEDGEHVEIYLE